LVKDKIIPPQEVTASQIRNGNPDAFRHFYFLYARKIYGFAYSYLKSRSEAEEVTQAVFVRIWENRSEIRDDLSLEGYLYKSTINHIYNLFKFKKIRAGNGYEPVHHEINDNSTLESIHFNNQKENIDVLIENLPAQRRVIFELSRKQGLSHEEIARKMKISVRTVENQIYKALKYLKANLGQELLFFLIFLEF
jgi:RNA polymerase sigma-70 factor (ECF subfamily)